MRRISVDERRARLGVRHALAVGHSAPDPVSAAEAVVGLHGSDPASTFLSVLARSPGSSIADVERCLYDDRTLVRVLAMRRTVFAVPRELATTCFAGAGDTVAASERRKAVKMLAEAGIDEPDAWMHRAERAALEVFERLDEVTTADLVQASPLLATRIELARGTKWATTQSMASRVLTVLSCQGLVVRARPRGGWTSSQFRWSSAERWAPGLTERPDAAQATVALATAWLRAYGPATPDDLQWWAGWTKTRTRSALAEVDTVAVDLDGADGLLLADDAEPVGEPAPWVALLPALDPSAMGWKHRDHLLGPHRAALYDVNGNAGPTVWADGQMVGGWAQRDDGEVVVRLLEDVGHTAIERVEERAADLTVLLGAVRLKARARGWTEVERELRA